MWKIHKSIYIVILFAYFISGCTAEISSTQSYGVGIFPLDSRFDPLLDKLGDHKGVGISTSFLYDGVYYQYTSTVLLVYAPDAAPKDRYRLYPLANDWMSNEPAVVDPGDTRQIYVNGHIIWNEVAPYYTRLGAAITGLPLTEVKYNSEKDRFEQWFENMGFYRNRDDGVGELRLMPYGSWSCESECIYPVVDDLNYRPLKIYDEGMLGDAEARFLDFVARLGSDFTGAPLTTARAAPDKYIEQVFENLVMVWNPERPDTWVDLRLLPQYAGISPEPPVPPSSASGMYFYIVAGELGYNIPQQFMDYITRHGTMELSGAPITEARRTEEGVIRQCFEKLCLIYDPNAPESLKIRPDDLGHAYNSQAAVIQQPSPEAAPTENVAPVNQVKLSLWEEYPMLAAGDTQVIGAAIFDGIQPLNGIQFAVAVNLPDGTQRMYQMPLTGENGQSIVVLEPFPAPKGTIILYEVCVMNLTNQPICMEENFLIWEDN